MQKRIIIVEVDVPGGDADYTHFLTSGSPYDVMQHGNVVSDEVLTEGADHVEPLPEV
jgi:hypothetical protein